jgi:hypothetical protein
MVTCARESELTVNRPVHCPAVKAPDVAGESEAGCTLLVMLKVTTFVNAVKIPFVASRAVIVTENGTPEV